MNMVNKKLIKMISRLIPIVLIVSSLAVSCTGKKTDGTITIDYNQKGADIPESMYGIFFEEINHSGDGGLYAELVQNRGFEETSVPEGYTVKGNKLYPPKSLHNHLTKQLPGQQFYRWPNEEIPAWSVTGAGAMSRLTHDVPLHKATPASLEVTLSPKEKTTIINKGYWGMNFIEGNVYDLRFYIRRGTNSPDTITVRLVSEEGKTLACEKIKISGNDWQEYKTSLTPSSTSHKGILALDIEGGGKVWLDYISLFPRNTFKNRPNGLRNDVATILAEMKPAFVRWPGGCIVEGISLGNRIQWKETLGDPMTRPGNYDTWGYRTTMGFGYHEFLQFCEDIGAAGMFVCNAGIGCQGRVGDACSDSDLHYFIDNVLDAIEYAIGSTNTEWGKKRAGNGHPAPFPLKYVEIGNENWGPLYTQRYDVFYKAIKEKYPDLVLISTLGLGGQDSHKKVDMIDPHWYVTPDYFFLNSQIFDHQPRTGYNVYVGEYACNIGVGGGNLLGALGEAAFLTGMERNSDLVHMASYAPLLENINDRVWPVNLIWMDSYRTMGRSSYHIQKMFAGNRPDQNLKVELTQPSLPVDASGHVGLGTWQTGAEYKDFRIIHENGTTVRADISKIAEEWNVKKGDWDVRDSIYVQKSTQDGCWTLWKNNISDKGTIEFKARKISGNEGFILHFGVKGANGYALNIGGWGNSKTAIGMMDNGGVGQVQAEVPQHIETGRWYNIKLVIDDSKFTYYCDGEKMLEAQVSRNRRYSVAGYDSKTNEIVLKVVNAEKLPFVTGISLKGADVEQAGKIITLSSASELDENDLDHPYRIVPIEKTYGRFGTNFQYTFQPWSFTIMRIKVK